jgi:UDP-4-amino-4,6-dideoxy-N-acetyl-beta-L-altrosamine transaminase
VARPRRLTGLSEVIPYGRQEINDDDVEAVTQVLRSDWLTQGPAVPLFEGRVASHVGVRHAIAVNSATSALHIACKSLGLGEGDELWTTPNTFVASANCARYCGAGVDFVDIDADTLNIDVSALEVKLRGAALRRRLPKIVVPVHFGGLPTNQERVWELAQEYGFRVVEDASHSIGALNALEPVGSCRWSDVTVFSFHPVKVMTSGEGGMCTTNDDELAFRMSILRTHGITREPSRMTVADPSPWAYEQIELGFNYRMTDIHAALGLSQIGRLVTWVERRNEIAERYKSSLNPEYFRWQHVPTSYLSSYHLFVVTLADDRLQERHLPIFESLRRRGIGVNLHYTPVHLQPYYRQLGFGQGMFPVAEKFASKALSIPMYPGLTETEQDLVISELEYACRNV